MAPRERKALGIAVPPSVLYTADEVISDPQRGQALKLVEPIVEQRRAVEAPKRVHRGQLFRKYFLLILALVCGALIISGGISLYFSYEENKEALASLQREKAAALPRASSSS